MPHFLWESDVKEEIAETATGRERETDGGETEDRDGETDSSMKLRAAIGMGEEARHLGVERGQTPLPERSTRRRQREGEKASEKHCHMAP